MASYEIGHRPGGSHLTETVDVSCCSSEEASELPDDIAASDETRPCGIGSHLIENIGPSDPMASVVVVVEDVISDAAGVVVEVCVEVLAVVVLHPVTGAGRPRQQRLRLWH